MKARHDPQDCPHCRESISPILVGKIPQTHGPYTVYVSNATCPKCGGKWLTQLDTKGE